MVDNLKYQVKNFYYYLIRISVCVHEYLILLYDFEASVRNVCYLVSKSYGSCSLTCQCGKWLSRFSNGKLSLHCWGEQTPTWSFWITTLLIWFAELYVGFLRLCLLVKLAYNLSFLYCPYVVLISRVYLSQNE